MKNNFVIMLIVLIILNMNIIEVRGDNAITISDSVVKFGRIDGEEPYYFYIPISWRDYIVVTKNSNLPNGSKEALNFYYEPHNADDDLKLFYILYIFKTDNYLNSLDYNFVAEIGDYTFASSQFFNNEYTNNTDIIIFNRFISELSSSQFIAKNIHVLSEEASESKFNNIYLNDVKMEKQSYVSSQDIVYLPIRDICEALGYEVTWNDEHKRIFLKKGDMLEVIYLLSNDTYKPLLINGSTYMPSMYYVQFLGLDVNIDSRKNVKIYE